MGNQHIKGRNGYIISPATTLPTLAIPNGSLATTATFLMVGNTGTQVISDIGGNAITITKNGASVVSTSTVVPYTGTTSVYLPNASNYLTFNNSIFAVGTGDFTIEMWVRLTALSSSNNEIFDLGTGGGRATGYLLAVTTPGTLQIFNNGLYVISSSASAIAINTWYHIAVVRLNGQLSMYISGSRVAQSGYMATTNITSTAVNMGRDQGAAGNNAYGGQCYVSNLRFTRQALYNGTTLTVPTADLTVLTTGTNWTSTDYGIWRLE